MLSFEHTGLRVRISRPIRNDVRESLKRKYLSISKYVKLTGVFRQLIYEPLMNANTDLDAALLWLCNETAL